jgi:hypothetical protein
VEGNWDNDNELAKTWEKRNVLALLFLVGEIVSIIKSGK